MEHIVEAVAIRIIGVVGQLAAERHAVDRYADTLAIFTFDIDQFDFEPAWKALAFRKRGVEAQRLCPLSCPARLDLGEVGGGDLVERELKLARNIRDIPEQVAKLFGYPFLEEPVGFPIAQMLLVFAEKLAGFTGEAQHGDDQGIERLPDRRALERDRCAGPPSDSG